MRLLQIVTITIGLTAAAPAIAQIYKWVDKNGVTNYSSTQPSGTATKVAVVAENISVYTPDKALTQAAARRTSEQAISEHIDRLERELESQRLERQYAAAARAQALQAAYDRCVAERRVDCDVSGGTYFYRPVLVAAPVRFRRPVFTPLVVPAGVSATNAGTADRFFHHPPGIDHGKLAMSQPRPWVSRSQGARR